MCQFFVELSTFFAGFGGEIIDVHGVVVIEKMRVSFLGGRAGAGMAEGSGTIGGLQIPCHVLSDYKSERAG